MSFTILLVEDDLDSRIALTLLLELEGFEVITASDGLAALELIKERSPDMIITDICMPGMSGIDLTRSIRDNLYFDALPIIAVTAATEQSRRDIIDAGASACFAKPIDISDLQNTIYSLAKGSTTASGIA
jgi:CheY-like chemotaxis protein